MEIFIKHKIKINKTIIKNKLFLNIKEIGPNK